MSHCEAFTERLIELARGATDDQLTGHVAECAGCARRLAEEQGLTDGLRALAAAEAHLGASPGLEALLRERVHAAPGTSGASRRRSRRWPLALAAAAAVLLVAGTLAFLRAPAPVPRPTASLPVPDAEFTALVYGEPLDGAEALHLARVSVPRSALPSLGWGELEDGPPLEAEVLVGQDGLARGIRFVSADAGGFSRQGR